MSKKKNIIVAIVIILVIAALIAGGILAYLWQQRNSLSAEVQSVSDLNWYYGGEEMTSYGTVTNDFYQDVYLLDDQTVAEVFVEEGQAVKAGDPLLAYDTTLTALQLEMKRLEVEGLQNKLVLSQRELEKLKKETPIPEYREPEPEPEPDPEPEPEPEPQLPQIDPQTGAYNYLSADVFMETTVSLGREDLKEDQEEEKEPDPSQEEGTDNPNEDQKEPEQSVQEPSIILCMPGCYLEGSYLNALAACEDMVLVRLQIINPNDGKPVKDQYWDISSRQFAGMSFEDDAKWSVQTHAPMEEEIPDDDYEDWGDDEEFFEPDDAQEPTGYTAKELAEAKEKEEKEIKDLDLQIRKAQLELDQMQKVSDDGVVKAEIDGTVKTVGDIANPPTDGSAFITVSGSEGLYVTGSLSELQLGEIQVGQTIYANSWESGQSFEATIQEISPYPTTNSNSRGEGNPNVSYYPYTAYIANTDGLKNGETVDLTMTPSRNSEEGEEGIFLQKAYVREENGKKYVLKADENGRLKKQFVETGKVIYGEALEIKSGLTKEDRIAFPYGKTAKEGVKVKGDSEAETVME